MFNTYVTEQENAEIAYLRNVEELVLTRLVQGSTKERPQLSEDSEEGRLATSVWTSNQDIHASLDLRCSVKIH